MHPPPNLSHAYLFSISSAVQEDPLSRNVSQTHSLKTAILFNLINSFGVCRPQEIPTRMIKRCFQCIDTACRLIGESPIHTGGGNGASRLGRLCALAHEARDVSEWLTMAAQIAEALCALCTELGTDEEKTICQKRMCLWNNTSVRHVLLCIKHTSM